ncbi:AAA family ATPase [Rubinisphaera sp.]|uniref:AAA family ATPase n=1 Tax=Rubinisphaera sp. TaxID=2024857 RepID=UPI0025D4F64D|nr:AAA family ATPase [Rubinisphaera sp.]|tara:strand:+ start:6556 stop:8103 length:1548 start_codon:yes stop_codon:yes gene_type:complete
MTKLTPRELLEELKAQRTATADETISHVKPSYDDDASKIQETDETEVSLFDSVFKSSSSGKSGKPTVCPPGGQANERISSLFNRVNSLLSETSSASEKFIPHAPTSLAKAGLNEDEVERLIFRFLLAKGVASGRQIAGQHKLPFALIDPLLKKWKHEQLVDLRNSAEMGDYYYAITSQGRERAQGYSESCSYHGAAPVKLHDYLKAMERQSIAKQTVCEEDLRRAFSDLLIAPSMLDKLGPAINSGRGMFLFGEPGNGKTSIAERVTSCFGSTIWIPRALGIDGDIIRLFDPGVHEEVEMDENDSLLSSNGIDQRWVQIVRPTVIAGGELTMNELEVVQHAKTGICESPLQLKSNCGTLVIDDFGRQRMPVDELLNRWIVPLEKRYDFLNLPSGKKIQVPFDQLIIFSTNLEPKDLVDGAFLRRIPYKIEVDDPSRADFIKLFEIMAPKFGMTVDRSAIEYLIETHYEKVNRPFRACQPRDLLLQVRNFCVYKNREKKMTPQSFDFAVENYFSVM